MSRRGLEERIELLEARRLFTHAKMSDALSDLDAQQILVKHGDSLYNLRVLSPGDSHIGNIFVTAMSKDGNDVLWSGTSGRIAVNRKIRDVVQTAAKNAGVKLRPEQRGASRGAADIVTVKLTPAQLNAIREVVLTTPFWMQKYKLTRNTISGSRADMYTLADVVDNSHMMTAARTGRGGQIHGSLRNALGKAAQTLADVTGFERRSG